MLFRSLEWVAARLEEITGRDDVALIVAGDSAGGNLAAVMAQRARDRNGPKIALQVLIYPVTDADFKRPSYENGDNQLILTREAMVWFDQAIAVDGALANAWLGRGLVKIRQGHAKAGLEDLQVAAAPVPG